MSLIKESQMSLPIGQIMYYVVTIATSLSLGQPGTIISRGGCFYSKNIIVLVKVICYMLLHLGLELFDNKFKDIKVETVTEQFGYF